MMAPAEGLTIGDFIEGEISCRDLCWIGLGCPSSSVLKTKAIVLKNGESNQLPVFYCALRFIIFAFASCDHVFLKTRGAFVTELFPWNSATGGRGLLFLARDTFHWCLGGFLSLSRFRRRFLRCLLMGSFQYRSSVVCRRPISRRRQFSQNLLILIRRNGVGNTGASGSLV